ncbi:MULTISPECIES: carbohydrate ABC transporter permease [unclassified Thermotoga]|uniref:carbohydrate ABC transporter permease n=1 Tax=unclassified Thermotoga TaxID=2631113 RepID=UPI000280EADA|nr:MULTISPECIES: carbohydrate ABC transporter permease [unclassified Thermotoga]AIY87352.1 binding-protein-dependent transport system inner membrane protein [Thermotoga sp. 2812B]EJX26661.1 binding-protein-dependent transport system inner membrane protein [Thermotoga sp. EMP]
MSIGMKVLVYIVAFIWLLWTFFPFYLLVINSFKARDEYFMSFPWQPPKSFSLGNFSRVFNVGFQKYIFNSGVVASFSLLILIFFATLASYSFAIYRYNFLQRLFLIFIIGLCIPIHTTLIPVFVLTRKIGLYDNLFGLVLPLAASQLPVSILVISNYMRGIPKDYIEAARIEGCSEWYIYWRIILPMSSPAVVAMGVFSFVMFWSEFVYALTLISNPKKWVITLGLYQFQGRYGMNIPAMASAAIVSLIPTLIIYAIFSKKIIEGVAAMGGLKE